MTNKHTPSPWIVASDKTSVLQVTSDTDSPFPCVVDCDSGYNSMSFEEAQANARLISAAPDLLAALEVRLAQIKALREARAAITKARGE